MSAGGSEQLGLEGMPRPLFACTPSRLTSWRDCPRRYLLTYVQPREGPRGQAWAHTTLGAVVHLALARWWAQPRDRRTPATARTLLERAWPVHGQAADGFADRVHSGLWRTRAAVMVERWAATVDPDDEPVAVERTMALRTDALALSGRVDRLDQRGDDLVVVDYKTGRSRPGDDDARDSLPLALYALAAGRSWRRRCVRVELHHLPTGGTAAHEHTPATLAGHLVRAEALAGQAVAATRDLQDGGDADVLFPPRPSAGCAWCDHVRACPSGRAAAGGPRRPWDGLPDELGPADGLTVPDEAA